MRAFRFLSGSTFVVAGLTEVESAGRRDSFLSHASSAFSEAQKKALLASPGSGSVLVLSSPSRKGV